MHFKILSAAALLAAMVSAIRVNAPSNTTVWAPTTGGSIQWESVSTDQQTFIMKITGPNTPVEGNVIAESVQTSAGSYTFTPTSPIPAGQYRINFVSADPANPGILAQSEYLTVGDGTTPTGTTSNQNAPGEEGVSVSDSLSATDSVSDTDTTTQLATPPTESVATPDPTLTVHSTKAPKTTAVPVAETPAQSPATPPNAPTEPSSAAPAPTVDASSANAETTPAASSGAGKLMVPSGLFALAFAAVSLLA